jgi:hypothetical protein
MQFIFIFRVRSLELLNLVLDSIGQYLFLEGWDVVACLDDVGRAELLWYAQMQLGQASLDILR